MLIAEQIAFSILERIVGVETEARKTRAPGAAKLSVSSNGSLGLKRQTALRAVHRFRAFSILERIVGVETDER